MDFERDYFIPNSRLRDRKKKNKKRKRIPFSLQCNHAGLFRNVHLFLFLHYLYSILSLLPVYIKIFDDSMIKCFIILQFSIKLNKENWHYI